MGIFPTSVQIQTSWKKKSFKSNTNTHTFKRDDIVNKVDPPTTSWQVSTGEDIGKREEG